MTDRARNFSLRVVRLLLPCCRFVFFLFSCAHFSSLFGIFLRERKRDTLSVWLQPRGCLGNVCSVCPRQFSSSEAALSTCLVSFPFYAFYPPIPYLSSAVPPPLVSESVSVASSKSWPRLRKKVKLFENLLQRLADAAVFEIRFVFS